MLSEELMVVSKNIIDELGLGLNINIYIQALIHEISEMNLKYELKKEIDILYKDIILGSEELQIVINNDVILAITTFKQLSCIKKLKVKLKNILQRTNYNHYIIINFEQIHKSLNNIFMFTSNEQDIQEEFHEIKDKNTKWSEFEDKCLISRLKQEFPIKTIARLHNRTKESIISRIYKIINDFIDLQMSMEDISQKLCLNKSQIDTILNSQI